MSEIAKASSKISVKRIGRHDVSYAGNCEAISKASAKRMDRNCVLYAGNCEAISKTSSAIARDVIGTLKTSYRD